MNNFQISPATDADRDWVGRFIENRWGSPSQRIGIRPVVLITVGQKAYHPVTLGDSSKFPFDHVCFFQENQ